MPRTEPKIEPKAIAPNNEVTPSNLATCLITIAPFFTAEQGCCCCGASAPNPFRIRLVVLSPRSWRNPAEQVHAPQSEVLQTANPKFLVNDVKRTRCATTRREDRAEQFLNESKNLRRGNQLVLQQSQTVRCRWSPVKLPIGPPHPVSQSGTDRGNMREWCVSQAVACRLQGPISPTCNDACHCGDSKKQEHLLSPPRQAVQQNSKQAHQVGDWTESAA